MNRIHRLVWNERTRTWVVAAETARSRGKGNGRAGRRALRAALLASGLAGAPAFAETPATTVVPAGGQTTAYVSANGVPVVNIEKANAAGISHNVYTRYDVEANGLVLNNGNSSQLERQSELAGRVGANLNLDREATVILNEVVSTNRSTLAGFTEVLGGKADVIVANPNGITCNGCGFINTDRATLTTGLPNLADDGSLIGFTVNRGDVRIEGLGANAGTQQIFDLVARSVTVNGKINTAATGSLGITAGNNEWSYAGRSVTGTVAGSGAAPAYAIDSSVLGGMYAGRIRIIATEAGVGVRVLGEAAASADDFALTSAGRIELRSAVSAARDLTLASTSADGSQDIHVNGASVSAGRDLSVSATLGQVALSGGELYAANNLTVAGATLSDVSAAAATRFAGANANVATSGQAAINGSVWGAGGALSGSFGSLAIGAGGATLYAGTTLDLSAAGNLSLGTAAIRSTGDMTLAAGSGAISTVAGSAQGIQTVTGNLGLTAGNGLSNGGTITADAGRVTARINGAFGNSGTLHAGTALDIADKANGGTGSLSNSGVLIADGDLVARLASFSNTASGRVQGTAGTTLTATSLSNAGTFIASATAGEAGMFSLGTLNNTGILQTASGDLALNVTGTLANGGKLLAAGNLTVSAGTSALAISNAAGAFVQAGGVLRISGANASLGNTASGTILGNTVDVSVFSVDNGGTLQSNGKMTLVARGGVSNAGTVRAKGFLASDSASLSNAGILQADQGSAIRVMGTLNNSGTLTLDATGAGGTLAAGYLANSGILQSKGAATLTIETALANAASGKLLAEGNLTILGADTLYALLNDGYLQSKGLLKISGISGGDGVDVTVGGTAVILGQSLDVNGRGMTVADGGLVSTTGSMTLRLNNLLFKGATSRVVAATSGTGAATITLGQIFSNPGVVHSGGSLSLTAPGIDNLGTGGISALQTLTLKAANGRLDNRGALYAGSALVAEATGGDLWNHSGATIDSGGDVTLKTTGTLTNNSTVNALRDITIVAPVFRNEIVGGVPARIEGEIVWGQYSPDAGYVCISVPGFECLGPEWLLTGYDGSWGWPYDAYYWYERYGYSQQSFVSPLTEPKPQIIAGRNMAITGFDAGFNTGGLLSAVGTMTLTGNAGATFVNDDLSLLEQRWHQTLERFEDCDIVSCAAIQDTYGTPYVYETYTLSSEGAGIMAGTLVASGFTLVNKGSPWTPSTTSQSADGAAFVSGGSAAANSQLTGGASAISFGGLQLTLPSNPNGYFVVSQNPDSQYLVETNPLFAVGSIFVGSTYMLDRYGFDPDVTLKRLGDANYEAYLVRQQLISQLGRNLLSGYADEAEQLRRLMDQAISEDERLGFNFGEPLTAEQIANLREDVVWMVKTSVAGQTVLAPVVYLAASTRDSVASGAVIAAGNVSLDLASLSNTGGTISGSESLTILSQGDITNTSGTISGGDVSLKSVDGSIINQTLARDDASNNTTLGKTATIQASGDLAMDAGEDILSRGANVSAGGDARLAAKGDITFTALEKNFSESSVETTWQDGRPTTTTTTHTGTTLVGSTLTVGGNLSATSGNDINIEASNVAVGADASLDAGGAVNIIALAETSNTETHSETSSWDYDATESTTVVRTTGAGSTFTTGGSLTVSSGGDTTILGSNVGVGGDLNVEKVGGDFNVTTFKNTVTVHSEKEESSLFGAGSASADAGTDLSQSSASASATLFQNTRETLDISSTTHTGSTIVVGGSLNAGQTGGESAIQGDVNIVGSTIATGGDLNLAAGGDINILAAEDTTTVSTTYASDQFSLGGSASVDGAEASFGYQRNESSGTVTETTAQVSGLSSGGSIVINAGGNFVEQGTQVAAAGDITVEADEIRSLAAENTRTESGDSLTVSASIGVSADTGLGGLVASLVDESGNPDFDMADASKSVHDLQVPDAGSVNGELSVSVNQSSYSGSGSQAVASGFSSGGDVRFTAREGDATFEGTNVQAAGSIAVTAEQGSINLLAAESQQVSSSASTDASVTVGVSGDGTISGSGSGGSSTQSSVTTTQTGATFSAGGALELKAKKDVTLVGTALEAGGTASITAEEGVIDFQAARTTTEYYSTSESANASVSANVTGKEGSVGGGYSTSTTTETSSTGTAGSISATNIVLNAQGDITLEGTHVAATESASIVTKGSIDFLAIEDTYEKTTTGASGQVDLEAGATSGGATVGGGSTNEYEASTTRTGGTLSAANLTLSAGEGILLEGTQVDVTKDARIDAGSGSLVLESAVSTYTNQVDNTQVELSAKGDSDEGKGQGSVKLEGEYEDTNRVTNQNVMLNIGGAADIRAEGGIEIAGTQVEGVESVIKAGSLDTHGADIRVEQREDVDQSTKTSFDVNVGVVVGGLGGSDDHAGPPDASDSSKDRAPSDPAGTDRPTGSDRPSAGSDADSPSDSPNPSPAATAGKPSAGGDTPVATGASDADAPSGSPKPSPIAAAGDAAGGGDTPATTAGGVGQSASDSPNPVPTAAAGNSPGGDTPVATGASDVDSPAAAPNPGPTVAAADGPRASDTPPAKGDTPATTAGGDAEPPRDTARPGSTVAPADGPTASDTPAVGADSGAESPTDSPNPLTAAPVVAAIAGDPPAASETPATATGGEVDAPAGTASSAPTGPGTDVPTASSTPAAEGGSDAGSATDSPKAVAAAIASESPAEGGTGTTATGAEVDSPGATADSVPTDSATDAPRASDTPAAGAGSDAEPSADSPAGGETPATTPRGEAEASGEPASPVMMAAAGDPPAEGDTPATSPRGDAEFASDSPGPAPTVAAEHEPSGTDTPAAPAGGEGESPSDTTNPATILAAGGDENAGAAADGAADRHPDPAAATDRPGADDAHQAVPQPAQEPVADNAPVDQARAQELAVLQETQKAVEEDGSLTMTAPTAEPASTDEGATEPTSATVPGKPDAPPTHDPAAGELAKQLDAGMADTADRIGRTAATTVALGPAMAGQGANDRNAATQKELGLAARQKMLADGLSTLDSDAARQDAVRKIEGLEVERLNTRLQGEQSFAGDLMAKAFTPLPGPDGMPQIKPAVAAATQQYMGDLARVSAEVGGLQGMRATRDADIKRLEAAESESDKARLQQAIAEQDLNIRQRMLDVTISATQAEYRFLMGMTPDATDPGALAAEAGKLMKTLNELATSRALLSAQPPGSSAGAR